MLRSMYSGISGLKNFQAKLDVIGNNIANVNTFGYKKERISFKDIAYQTLSGGTAGSAAANGLGGTNSKQIGLGSSIASIDNIMTNSSLQSTGRDLDLGINGDGFFVVQDGQNNKFYTRAGNFFLDDQGYLVNTDGMKVLDSSAAQQPIKIDKGTYSSFSIGSDGNISAVVKGTNTISTLGPIGVATFSNPSGLTRAGGNNFKASNSSGAAIVSTPGANGTGVLLPGSLEMSNVDLSEEFTEMIVAQRGFQANTRIITTSDQILEELVNLKR